MAADTEKVSQWQGENSAEVLDPEWQSIAPPSFPGSQENCPALPASPAVNRNLGPSPTSPSCPATLPWPIL